MKCLRSGFCCINYDVIIVDIPLFGVDRDNLKHKKGGTKCQHLQGDKPGEYSCAIHGYVWYKETPCYAFGQVEANVTDDCRVGAYLIK